MFQGLCQEAQPRTGIQRLCCQRGRCLHLRALSIASTIHAHTCTHISVHTHVCFLLSLSLISSLCLFLPLCFSQGALLGYMSLDFIQGTGPTLHCHGSIRWIWKLRHRHSFPQGPRRQENPTPTPTCVSSGCSPVGRAVLGGLPHPSGQWDPGGGRGEEPTLTTGACGDPDSLGSLTARVGTGAGLTCRVMTAPLAPPSPLRGELRGTRSFLLGRDTATPSGELRTGREGRSAAHVSQGSSGPRAGHTQGAHSPQGAGPT